jgi:hypothetical protein
MIETKSPALVVGLFLAASAFGQIASPTVSGPVFPPFSLTAAETAYVNLTNVAQPGASGPAPMCLVTLTFYTGSESGQSALASNVVRIGSGEFYSVPLPYANTGSSGPRVLIRAEVVIASGVPDSSSAPAACTLAASLEVLDSKGAIHIVIPGVDPPAAGSTRPPKSQTL